MEEHEEHRAPDWLVWVLAAFFAVMALCALAFWASSAVAAAGVSGVISAVGPGAIAIFGALHIPAAIVGVLLLQWRRPVLPVTYRVALEAGTIYFGGAVLLSIFFNYLAVSFMDRWR